MPPKSTRANAFVSRSNSGRIASSLALALALACGGSGDSPDPQNLAFEKIDLAAGLGTLQVGHPVTVDISVAAVHAASEVPVQFYLLDKARYDGNPADRDDPDFPDAGDDALRLPIGSALLDVRPGRGVYTARFTLPYFVPYVDEAIALNLDVLSTGGFTSAVVGPYEFRFIGFGDRTAIRDLDADEEQEDHVLVDENIANTSGATIRIFRTDGEPFTLRSFDAADLTGVAETDFNRRIEVSVPASGASERFVPTSASFATFEPGIDVEEVTTVQLGLVSSSIDDFAVDRIVLESAADLGAVATDDALEQLLTWAGIPIGSYYLFAEIDPANAIGEASEEDNGPAPETFPADALVVQVDAAQSDKPFVYLEQLILDYEVPEAVTRSLGLLQPDEKVDACSEAPGPIPGEAGLVENIQNSVLGITAVINAFGSAGDLLPPDEAGGFVDPHAQPIPRVDVGVELSHPSLGGETITLRYWDPEAERFEERLSVYELEPGVSTPVHLALKPPDENDPALNALLDALRDEQAACIDACPLAGVDACPYLEGVQILGQDAAELCRSVDTIPPLAVSQFCSALRQSSFGSFLDANDFPCDGRTSYEIPAPACIVQCAASIEDVALDVVLTAFDDSGAPLVEYGGQTIGVSKDVQIDLDIQGIPGLSNAPPQPGEGKPIATDAAFSEGFGNGSTLRVGVEGGIESILDGRGASAVLNASLPIGILGFSFDLLDISADGRGFPKAIEVSGDPLNYFRWNLGVLGASVVKSPEFEVVVQEGAEAAFCLGGNVQELTTIGLGGKAAAIACVTAPGPVDETEAEKKERIRKCQLEEGAFGVSKTDSKDGFIGSVPVNYEWSVYGLIGLEARAKLWTPCDENQVSLFFEDEPVAPEVFNTKVGPYGTVGTDINAGVGNSNVPLGAGAGGELELIGLSYFHTLKVPLEFELGNVGGTIETGLTGEAKGPNGRVYAYVKYPCVKTCRKWGVRYPCGVKSCKSKKTLWSFNREKDDGEDVLACKQGYTSMKAAF